MYQVKCPNRKELCFKDVDGVYGIDTIMKNISTKMDCFDELRLLVL